jgi:hypothetical protein
MRHKLFCIQSESEACSAVIPYSQWKLVSPSTFTGVQNVTLLAGVYDNVGTNGSVYAYFMFDMLHESDKCGHMLQM